MTLEQMLPKIGSLLQATFNTGYTWHARAVNCANVAASYGRGYSPEEAMRNALILSGEYEEDLPNAELF